MRVVPDQNSTRTPALAHRASHLAKGALQGVALVDGRTQRVMRVDAVDGQGGRFEVGAFERLYVVADRLAASKVAFCVDVDQHRGKLQQCVSRSIEAPGLHVDDDWQETAKAVCHSDFLAHLAALNRLSSIMAFNV